MNQTIIRMIGKLDEDKKAKWSEHLPEIMLAYNGTRSAVTGFSPYFLIFGRKSRMPVDYLFPTIRDSPHQTRKAGAVILQPGDVVMVRTDGFVGKRKVKD